jgi:hypothetical protein
MSCMKKTIYYAHRRLCASNIMRSTSQLPIPGPPRREREGSTRFCRDFKLAFSDGSAIENVRLVLAVATASGSALVSVVDFRPIVGNNVTSLRRYENKFLRRG